MLGRRRGVSCACRLLVVRHVSVNDNSTIQHATCLAISRNFTHIILDTLALAELLLSEDSESNWYDSYNTNEDLSYSSIDTISSLKEDLKFEKNNPPLPAKKIAKKKKEIKGQSIPFDKNRFTIQIASKRKLGDAKKVAGKLIESGYDAYIQKANFKKSNEVWFRVRVGSYDNRQTASAVAESLSKTQKETAWVDFVRYEN